MSVSGNQGNQRRFNVNWEDIRESQAEDVVETFPENDDQRTEGDEELQEKDMMGGEAEHIVERQNGQTPEPVERDFTIRHMGNISEHPTAEEVKQINTAENNEVAEVELKFSNYSGTSDVDVGAVEKEDVTGIVRSIDEMIENFDLVENVTAETNPDDDVVFRRQGHLTSMMMRGSGKDFDWDKAEQGIYPGTEMISGAPRYFAFDDTYDGVMQVAGTGSLQVTMRPKIYEEHEGDADAWIRDFSGGGERIGMHAVSPLIYGPFQASPVIDEVLPEGKSADEACEEDFRKVIETLNGRDKAYGQGFQNEHDSKGKGKDQGEYVTENSKAAYSPELAEIQDMEDQVDFPADSEWTFSAPTPAGKMKVVEEGETYDPEAEYDTLADATFLDEEENGLIRVGHEDWDLPDGRNVIKTNEFPEHERFEGTVYVVDDEGNREKKRVVVDYQDEEIFPDMDEESFKDTAKGHYTADATAVWQSWRMRPGMPAIEYRDMCNNPFRDAGMATQVGAFRRWREIQDFAEDELGLRETDAQKLRIGVNGMDADHENDPDYLDNVGLNYTINEEEDITLQDAWLGNGLETGLLDIISEGVEEMTDDSMDAYSVEDYRDTMEGLVENGLTPGEMMAKQQGVDLNGEILYDEDDIFVGEGSDQYRAS